MESRSSPGTAGRYVLFIVLSFGILLLNMYLMAVFAPRREKAPAGDQVAEQREPEAEIKGQQEGTEPEAEEAEEEGESTDASDVDAREPQQVDAVEEEAQPAQQPTFPRTYATMGSVDPESPYRMLVTVTSRGAAVLRVELSSRRYRDLENRSGYLGHVVVDTARNGKGCPVEVVGPGTPAQAAGLRAGDQILTLAGRPVTGFESLERVLAKTKPGQTVELTVDRQGKPISLTASLGRCPLEVIRPGRPHSEKESPQWDDPEDPHSFLLSLRQLDDLAIEDVPDDEDNGKSRQDKERPTGLDREIQDAALRSSDWELVQSRQDEAVFRQVLPRWGLEIFKTYRLARVPDDASDDGLAPAYHLELAVEVRNTSQAQHTFAYQLDGPTGLPTEGYWFANKVGRGWGAVGLRDVVVSFGGPRTSLIGAPAIADGKADKVWKHEVGDPTTALSFIGVDAQYFSAVLIPQKKSAEEVWFSESMPIRVGGVTARWKKLTNTSCRLISQTHDLAPGQSLVHGYKIFVGPKKPALLSKYGLKEVVYYGWFWWVAVPMLQILHFFHDYVVFNYGLAIIMLTVLVRSCMFPLSKKQALNAQKMQELQPEIKRLTEHHKNNMEARTKAQQELFRKHNFNPMGGCLPVFMQLPIFIGLYRSLMVNVELRQAPLITESIRWCSNLAAPDMLYDWSWFMPGFVTSAHGFLGLGPYFNLLPIITIVLFLVQQKMFMPPPADEQAAMQQNIMKFMMLFIGLLFFKVASGLCIYFIASSLWGVAERKLLPKRAAAHADQKASMPTLSAKAKPAAGRQARPMPSRNASGDGAAAKKKRKKSRGKR